MPTTTEKTARRASTPAEGRDDRASAGRSAAFQWGVLGLLIAILLASAGYLGWHYTHIDSDPLGDDRDAAMATADKFMATINTYGPDMVGKDGKTMPSYRSRVGDLLTAKYETVFLQNVPYAEATVTVQGAGRSCKIYATGVAALDDDSATVLVSGGLTLTYPKAKGSAQRVVAAREQFRAEVDLVKQHGHWLVNNWSTAETPPSTGGAGVQQ